MRLAHKHYCHFYEKSAFFDTRTRKRLYTPFKEGEANIEIADLYIQYKNMKLEFLQSLEIEWQSVLNEYFIDYEDPDFVKSGKNSLYDLWKRSGHEIF